MHWVEVAEPKHYGPYDASISSASLNYVLLFLFVNRFVSGAILLAHELIAQAVTILSGVAIETTELKQERS